MTISEDLIARALRDHNTLKFGIDSIVIDRDNPRPEGGYHYRIRCSCGHLYKPSEDRADEIAHLTKMIAQALESGETN